MNENPDQGFTSRAHASVKLPKLDVTTFSGDPLKWQEFWDNFESTIHLNDNLSPVDKFKYLRSFLTEDALRLVDGYRLTSANSGAVLKALEERYGRKQMIIFADFEAMLAVPVATHDIKQLRMVSDECEKHIRNLVALGLPEETFAQVFTPIMLSKLPKYVKMELHRKNGTQLWSLSNLREFLKDEILARDMSQRTFGGANEEKKTEGIQMHDTPKHKTNQKKPIKTQGRQHATSSLLSNATRGQKPLSTKPGLVEVDILIGNDYYHEFVGTERIKCPNGPYFLSSTLGFIATGWISTDQEGTEQISSLLLTSAVQSPRSNFQLERFWSLEDIGIKDERGLNEDDRAVEIFNKSVSCKDGRYYVGWPWKDEKVDLEDNFSLAYGRLEALLRRLQRNLQTLQAYRNTILEQERLGIIKRAPVVPTGKNVYYMQHHCVVTPTKTTTKLRVVYDASSKGHNGTSSLNESLYRGPVMLEDLCGLLMRFGLMPIAMVSNIEKVFLQVGLQESERDCLLWVEGTGTAKQENQLVTYRFCRVPFGVVSSPFLLAATVTHHLKQDNSDGAKDIMGNMYVDNVVGGKGTVEEAVKYYNSANFFFRSASMNLREWYTNSVDLMSRIDSADRGKDQAPKVLGMLWNPQKDTIQCSAVKRNGECAITKRQLLQSLSRLFDPSGLFSPVTVNGKILKQDLWQKKYKWDEQLPEEVISKWEKIQLDLAMITKFEISRKIGPPAELNERCTTQWLHCFCDASARAYAAVVYLQTMTSNGVSANIIFAKSRVAPLKELTIPRLELVAVVNGSRLLKFVEAQLSIPIVGKILWSDSQCVLHWINKDQVSTTFENNRIREMKQLKDVQFTYVPTAENSADLPSRRCNFGRLSQSKLWLNGPQWLQQKQEKWPEIQINYATEKGKR